MQQVDQQARRACRWKETGLSVWAGTAGRLFAGVWRTTPSASSTGLIPATSAALNAANQIGDDALQKRGLRRAGFVHARQFG